jgi:acyl-CoA thioesterase-1
MRLLIAVALPPVRLSPWTRWIACAAALTAGIMLTCLSEARAQSTTIVAFGGSNTRGKGVSPSEAWPARLQAMLRAKAVNASVINAGVDGDTSRGMLARLDSAVPSDTDIVILHVSGRNDRRQQVGNRAANMAAIRNRLAARKIKIVPLTPDLLRAARNSDPHPDGVHIGPRGHARIAASLLPRVLAAIRR